MSRKGYLTRSGDTLSQLGKRVLLASSGQRPRVLLAILQGKNSQSLTTKNDLAANVNHTKIEKSCPRSRSMRTELGTWCARSLPQLPRSFGATASPVLRAVVRIHSKKLPFKAMVRT